MRHLLIIILFSVFTLQAQEKYEFTNVVDIEASSVKSQDKTGTCWSFSTSSFIESEIHRITGLNVDISEMYPIRKTYEEKSWNYVMRQGKTQLNEGGLAHDFINSIYYNGLVTEIAYGGIKSDGNIYDHSKIVPQLKTVLDSFIKDPKNSDWKKDISEILDKEIGKTPTEFSFGGRSYTPKNFAKAMKIEADNYITITSFSHKPFNRSFVLNIPDNFSSGSMFNVPIKKLVTIVSSALVSGYTVELDIDVSEKTFSAKYGMAVLPLNEEDYEKSFTTIVEEKKVTQEYRQEEFENYNTTDDHLMHIVGIVKDQERNYYYKVKNSWGGGSDKGNGGYIYMSLPYFKLKVISILLHKKALQ